MPETKKMQLRSITYDDAQKNVFTAFVAMTDSEFGSFIEQKVKSLAPFYDRILLTVGGDNPSAEDKRAAMDAFSHLYKAPTDKSLRCLL